MLELLWLLLQIGLARVPNAGAPTDALAAAAAKTPTPCAAVARVAEVPIWRKDGAVSAVIFRSGMAIDVDGAPKAYRAGDTGALNRLSGAGRPGRWWALVTKDGAPVVQGPSDPAPGYYLSMTSLQNPAFAITDPRRYVDASTIPYVVLPEAAARAGGLRLGDLAAVVNQGNGKIAYAIYADQGPKDKLGEGSLDLANRLRTTPLPDNQGVRQSLPKGIVYVLFPGSGNRRPKSREQIGAGGKTLLERIGGLPAVNRCLGAPREPEGLASPRGE